MAHAPRAAVSQLAAQTADDETVRALAAGQALREWRQATERRWSHAELAKRLGDHHAEGRAPERTLICRWETAARRPQPDHVEALRALGAPVAGWEQERGGAKVAAQDGPEQVRAMLDAGEPLARVYDAASRAQAAFLNAGLSPDRKRAWDTLLRTLRQGSAAEDATIDRHPEFSELVEDLVAAVVGELGAAAPVGIEGRIADRLEELQAARAESSKRRAA